MGTAGAAGGVASTGAAAFRWTGADGAVRSCGAGMPTGDSRRRGAASAVARADVRSASRTGRTTAGAGRTGVAR
ncbi:hypothetical protein [Streptomyces showdoensis]|uniref:Uncharacterized protein n=1 Tax=Streptomyces showdoensis TaxID=68268 RepID=A0A2P2GC15_STREW|nr:hypothetical protein VO63_36875 [Streptomyces showdoensis]